MRHLPAGIALAFGAAAAPVAAQVSPAGEAEDRVDRLSASVGAVLVSKYVSRGVGFAEEPSLQPYVTLTLNLPEATGGAVTDVRLSLGNWNSVKLGSVEATEAGQLTRFYESDISLGAAVELADRWTIAATYYRYESLSDSFDGYNDFELIVGFDDSGLWGNGVPLANFALSPALRLAQEAGRPGRPDALYVQPSLTPSFDLGQPDRTVRIAVPLVLGLSDTYYDSVRGGHQTFGFFRTGLSVSGRPFPEKVAALQVDAGVDVWILNDRVINGLGDNEVVGRLAMNWSF